MSFSLPSRVLFVSVVACLPWAGHLGGQELRLRLAPRAIEVTGVTPGASVTLVGVIREHDGLDFGRLREALRDGDGDGMVRVEFSRDIPLMIVAAIEDELGRTGVGTMGVGWAYDSGVLRDYGVEVFWLRPGGGEGWARVDQTDLFEAPRAGARPHAALPKFLPRDLVFAVDLTTLRSVLVELPEEIGPAAPGR